MSESTGARKLKFKKNAIKYGKVVALDTFFSARELPLGAAPLL